MCVCVCVHSYLVCRVCMCVCVDRHVVCVCVCVGGWMGEGVSMSAPVQKILYARALHCLLPTTWSNQLCFSRTIVFICLRIRREEPSNPEISTPLQSSGAIQKLGAHARTQTCTHTLPQEKNSGEEKPGKKGISLQREQWATLKAALPQLAAAQEAGNTDMPAVAVGSMRKAYVSEYK